MRRLLVLLAIAAVAVTAAAGAAHATTPCFQVSGGTGDPWNGTCFHWPDNNRADKTYTGGHATGLSDWMLTSASWPSNLLTAINNAAVNMASTIYGQPTVNTTTHPACPAGAVPGQPQIFICLTDTGTACGGLTNYVACAQPYIYGEWVAAKNMYMAGPHIYAIEADFRPQPVDLNGNPVPWDNQLAGFATCHEITGHGYGGDHSAAPGGLSGNPASNASCLTSTNYYNPPEGPTPTTLGSAVKADINAWANHNDPSSIWPDRRVASVEQMPASPVARLVRGPATVAKPWLYAELGIDAKPVLKTKAQLRLIHTPAPFGTVYVVKTGEIPAVSAPRAGS